MLYKQPSPVCCLMLPQAIRSAGLAHAAGLTLWILSVWMEKKGSGNLHSGDGKLCQLGILKHRQGSTGACCLEQLLRCAACMAGSGVLLRKL